MNRFKSVYDSVIIENKVTEWNDFKAKSKKDYISALITAMVTANASDNDESPSWMKKLNASSDYNPINKILRKYAGEKFVDNLVDNGYVDWSLMK